MSDRDTLLQRFKLQTVEDLLQESKNINIELVVDTYDFLQVIYGYLATEVRTGTIFQGISKSSILFYSLAYLSGAKLYMFKYHMLEALNILGTQVESPSNLFLPSEIARERIYSKVKKSFTNRLSSGISKGFGEIDFLPNNIYQYCQLSIVGFLFSELNVSSRVEVLGGDFIRETSIKQEKDLEDYYTDVTFQVALSSLRALDTPSSNDSDIFDAIFFVQLKQAIASFKEIPEVNSLPVFISQSYRITTVYNNFVKEDPISWTYTISDLAPHIDKSVEERLLDIIEVDEPIRVLRNYAYGIHEILNKSSSTFSIVSKFRKFQQYHKILRKSNSQSNKEGIENPVFLNIDRINRAYDNLISQEVYNIIANHPNVQLGLSVLFGNTLLPLNDSVHIVKEVVTKMRTDFLSTLDTGLEELSSFSNIIFAIDSIDATNYKKLNIVSKSGLNSFSQFFNLAKFYFKGADIALFNTYLEYLSSHTSISQSHRLEKAKFWLATQVHSSLKDNNHRLSSILKLLLYVHGVDSFESLIHEDSIFFDPNRVGDLSYRIDYFIIINTNKVVSKKLLIAIDNFRESLVSEYKLHSTISFPLYKLSIFGSLALSASSLDANSLEKKYSDGYSIKRIEESVSQTLSCFSDFIRNISLSDSAIEDKAAGESEIIRKHKTYILLLNSYVYFGTRLMPPSGFNKLAEPFKRLVDYHLANSHLSFINDTLAWYFFRSSLMCNEINQSKVFLHSAKEHNDLSFNSPHTARQHSIFSLLRRSILIHRGI